MKWTNAFIPTFREAPAGAKILSHKLLLRAGLIRKLAGGVYTFLPLGLRTLRKVEQIVREEMDRAGHQHRGLCVSLLHQPQCSTNLLAADWFNLGAAFVATNNLNSVTNATGDGGLRFYRLRVQ